MMQRDEDNNGLVEPEVQATWFARVREARLTETTEDYVELIADLLDVKKEARSSDLAERFGVSHPTVSKVLSRLIDQGYIESQPYRSIFLTPKGRRLARRCKERHLIVVNFLLKLGVDKQVALVDAEGIEHHLSDQTLGIMKNFKGAKGG